MKCYSLFLYNIRLSDINSHDGNTIYHAATVSSSLLPENLIYRYGRLAYWQRNWYASSTQMVRKQYAYSTQAVRKQYANETFPFSAPKEKKKERFLVTLPVQPIHNRPWIHSLLWSHPQGTRIPSSPNHWNTITYTTTRVKRPYSG